MNTGDQDFPQYRHIEKVQFEKKPTENSKKFAILRKRRFCDIGFFFYYMIKDTWKMI